MNKTNDEWRETLISALGRIGLLLLVMMVLLLISVFPLPFGAFGEIRPAFILMAIYYWAITRPGIFTLGRAFVLGIVFDLLAGYPLGMNAALFVLVHWLISIQRKFLLGQSFRVLWAGFVVTVLAVTVLQLVLFSAFNMSLMPPRAALLSALFTCLLFPVAAPVLSVFGRWISARASSLA